MKVSIGRAARELGVSRETLRKWESEGKIAVDRASNGRRRYDLSALSTLKTPDTSNTRLTLGYARVSSPGQWGSLNRQLSLLESCCTLNGWAFQIIKDIGTSLDLRNSGLRELIARICDGEVGRIVIPSANQLPRIGMELILTLCEIFNTEVVILNAIEFEDFDEELTQDIEHIASLFSARLYDALGVGKAHLVPMLRQAAAQLRPDP